MKKQTSKYIKLKKNKNKSHYRSCTLRCFVEKKFIAKNDCSVVAVKTFKIKKDESTYQSNDSAETYLFQLILDVIKKW